MQIEGAFVQGLGWAAIEEVKWGDSAHAWVPPGALFTRGPGAYKLPAASDVPTDFRVALLAVRSTISMTRRWAHRISHTQGSELFKFGYYFLQALVTSE